MSDIVLSASVRQNLLSLQSTADLLATTQNRLATGNKVNTALDNPTNYFTAQNLNSRASDISNLLDGVSNGVQVLQAANTGITSLQKLVDTAKSIANQALQATSGYSSKAAFTSAAISGASADDLLGGTSTNAVATGTSAITAIDLTADGATNAVASAGSAITAITPAANAAETGTVDLSGGLADPGSDITFSINSQTVTLTTGTGSGTGGNFTLSDIETAINGTAGVGVTASDDGTHLVLTSTGTAGSSDAIVTSGTSAAGLGISDGTVNGTDISGGIDASGGALSFDVNGTTVNLSTTGGTSGSGHYSGDDIATAINGAVTGVNASYSSGKLVITSTGTAGATDQVKLDNFVGTGFDATKLGYSAATETDNGAAATNDTFDVNGQTVTLAGGSSYDGTAIADAINTQVGTTAGVSASYSTGKLVITSTGTAGATDQVKLDNFTGTSFDATKLGYAAATETDNGADGVGGLSGLTLTIGATADGTATDITFGSAAGQIKSLNDLNDALAANNLEATLSTDGKLTITTTNDEASAAIGALGGTVFDTGNPFAGKTASTAVKDVNAQSTRANLVAQYNNVLSQIDTTAQDSSYNGVNLLNGDQLKLVFNETGKSSQTIQGVNFDAAGLGLSQLTEGTDFIDNAATNKVLSGLDTASSTLRSEASTLGSNLSIVQIRQDFSKNLINVLQTGASNLTLADTNEEAANSQALSTRQSIAVSALSLANQSQQSVLRLLQ